MQYCLMLSKWKSLFQYRHPRSSYEPRQKDLLVWVSETSTATCCDKKKRKVSIAPHTASLQQNLTGIRCNKTNHNGIILYVCDSQI